jgi:hypothetical protein
MPTLSQTRPAIQRSECPKPTMYVLNKRQEIGDNVGPSGRSLLWLAPNVFDTARKRGTSRKERATAVKMFLKVGCIKGESRDTKHRDDIVVTSWEGASRSAERRRPGAGVRARSFARTSRVRTPSTGRTRI